ncbi:MAG: autotransporter outer membrane beta-barrel domain-containing protein, partial [Phascolarctobacterium sp.]|nr:autotransporter outer membrane beta-barrel domain-containing protein [Phascolarctobacterium sp.]
MKKNLAKKVTLSILAGAVLMSSSVVWAAVTTPPNPADDDWVYDGVNIWHTFGDEIQLSTGTDKNFTSDYSSTNAGVATGGKVIISDGTFTGDIYGGYAVGLSDAGEASGNTVTISGGAFAGKVCGGYVMTMPNSLVNATKNTVTISGTANLENAELFGGAVPLYPPRPGGSSKPNVQIIGIASAYGGASTPNTLNIGTADTMYSGNVKGIAGFDVINFASIDWEKDDGTDDGVIKVETLELQDTKVTVGKVRVAGGTKLNNGDVMALISVTGNDGINGSISNDETVAVCEGVANVYKGYVKQFSNRILLGLGDGPEGEYTVPDDDSQGGGDQGDGTGDGTTGGTSGGNTDSDQGGDDQGDGGDQGNNDSQDGNGNQGTGGVDGGTGGTPTPERNNQVLVLGESRAAAVAFTNQGSELIETGLNALARDNEKDTKVFAAVYGNHSEYETGSHVNVNGWSGIVGIGKTNDDGLTVGAFFENGEGNYSTHNIFTNDYIRGDGEACYNGGGFLVRKDNANGVYAEASLRAGNLQNELRNAVRNGSELTGYDIDTFYYGAHVGVGKVIARGNDGDSVDVYGKFIYTHHDGETFDIGGTATKFDSVESERLRLGFRINEVQTNKLNMYYGAAWEYEFGGDADNTVVGYDLSTPSLGGSTVIGEIGAHYKAS